MQGMSVAAHGKLHARNMRQTSSLNNENVCCILPICGEVVVGMTGRSLWLPQAWRSSSTLCQKQSWCCCFVWARCLRVCQPQPLPQNNVRPGPPWRGWGTCTRKQLLSLPHTRIRPAASLSPLRSLLSWAWLGATWRVTLHLRPIQAPSLFNHSSRTAVSTFAPPKQRAETVVRGQVVGRHQRAIRLQRWPRQPAPAQTAAGCAVSGLQ